MGSWQYGVGMGEALASLGKPSQALTRLDELPPGGGNLSSLDTACQLARACQLRTSRLHTTKTRYQQDGFSWHMHGVDITWQVTGGQ